MDGQNKVGIVLLVCLAGIFAVGAYDAWEKHKQEPKQEQFTPRVIKIKEVIGQVVGGPQIVSGNPLIGYVVYIEETKTWGALHADGCPPQTRDYSRVVMYQRDSKPGGFGSAWYTFLRSAK